MYVPHQNLCQDQEDTPANYIAGTPYVGSTVRMYAGPGGYRGVFAAWDPQARRYAWEIRENFPVWSGALVTAGNVAFYGTMEGWFKAVDARNGKSLWQFKAGSGIVSQPITYRGPDGKQYVAVLAGVGGWAGAIVAGDLDPRDGSAALGFVNAMGDLPQHTGKGGMLYVFALP
jgi:glucose dehydrogenase